MSNDGILRTSDGELAAGFVDGDTVVPLAVPLPPRKSKIAKSKSENDEEKTVQEDHCAQELGGRCCRAIDQVSPLLALVNVSTMSNESTIFSLEI
jgi:hypothetical protein